MDETKKKIICIVIGVLLVISIFSLGWVLCRHYGNLESSNGDDVSRTIQQIETESGRTRNELDNARTELERGQARADDAEKTTGRLQDSNEQSRAVIEDSQRLLGEIRDEFADIDRTNGITETQTGNQEPAE